MPDVSTKLSIVWKLPGKGEYWVACHYLFSNLLLTRKLPDGLRIDVQSNAPNPN